MFRLPSIILSDKNLTDYLIWRQRNGWRNHNKCLRVLVSSKVGAPPEKQLKTGETKSKEIHELLFKHGINTPEAQSGKEEE